MLRAEIAALIMQVTGMQPDPAKPGETISAGGPNVNSGGGDALTSNGALPGPMMDSAADVGGILQELNTLAYGTKLPQRRNPDNTDSD
jgi:hypothetical protein